MVKVVVIVLACLDFLIAGSLKAIGDELFTEGFDKNTIASGWSWLRENPEGWSLSKGKLKIRTNGSLWETQNTQQNVLLRDVPAESADAFAIEVTVNSRLKLSQRYEHGGLIWYLDDDNWVTLTQLNHVQDKTQKIMLVYETSGLGRASDSRAEPFNFDQVDLRLVIRNRLFTAHYRKSAKEAWKKLGSIIFPQSDKSPRIGLIAGDCPDTVEHWVVFDNFIVERI